MASAPIHHIARAHRAPLAVFLSANSVQLSHAQNEGSIAQQSLSTSIVVPQSLKPDQSDAARFAQNPQICFPRIAEFSHSDKYLALTGDDKVLRVWRLENDADGSLQGFGLNTEVLIKHLPKRAAMLHWMETNDTSEELIVVDRFGDVRSFLLDDTLTAASVAITAPSANNADDQDELDSPADRSMQILLGHVGMITSLAFVPSRTGPSSVPPFIITGDRDEHIRISRWGPERAAYVIERFLQGSRSFVGGLAVVSDSKDELRLISAEGGDNLRVWSLPSAVDAAQIGEGFCLSRNAVTTALAPFVLAREREEKKRESRALQHSSKKRRKQLDGASDESHPTASQYALESKPTLVISKLVSFADQDGLPHLLMVVEGATAIFTLPLSVLLDTSSTEGEQRDVAQHVQATETGLPILSLVLRTDQTTRAVSVWTSLDTRAEFHSEKGTEAEVRAFDFKQGRFEPSSDPLLESVTPASTDSGAARCLLEETVVSGLSLYPSLTTWPKIETPSSAEIIATRTTRKGRFNHPLDTSLVGIHATAVNDTNDVASGDDNEQRSKLVKTMQGGKRERGRERNREAIRQAQQATAQAQERNDK